MMRGLLADPEFRGQFSGHETFPLRHLWLRKAYDCVSRFPDGAPRSVFTSPESIVDFGVGKNMVTSIRHWAHACNIICEENELITPTRLAEFLFDARKGRDPFMESVSTTWLLHWIITSEPSRTTTWYFAFNHFSLPSFDRSTLERLLRDLCVDRQWPQASAATIKRDVECFIRCYVPKSDSRHSEDSLEPVLAELGLIRSIGSRAFEFRRGPKPSLSQGVFLFALNDFWSRFAPEQNTLSVEAIAYEPGSPGRVFRLDEHSLIERLASIGDAPASSFAWTDTAGVRNVSRLGCALDPLALLDVAYEDKYNAEAA